MYTYIIYTTNMTPTADVKCDVNYNNIKNEVLDARPNCTQSKYHKTMITTAERPAPQGYKCISGVGINDNFQEMFSLKKRTSYVV